LIDLLHELSHLFFLLVSLDLKFLLLSLKLHLNGDFFLLELFQLLVDSLKIVNQ